MSSTTTQRLALPALALAGALVLTACGGGADTASPGASSSEHSGGHSAGSDSSSNRANDADVAFLTGMVPHHGQAVEMSEIVLAANPPADVASVAQRVKDAQDPEIEQMTSMLEALGRDSTAEHGADHRESHGGMMSEQDMAALEAATGTEAARLYLEAMIEHHEGAIEASDAQLAEGEYEPALELAEEIKAAQQAEITEMEQLLQDL